MDCSLPAHLAVDRAREAGEAGFCFISQSGALSGDGVAQFVASSHSTWSAASADSKSSARSLPGCSEAAGARPELSRRAAFHVPGVRWLFFAHVLLAALSGRRRGAATVDRSDPVHWGHFRNRALSVAAGTDPALEL